MNQIVKWYPWVQGAVLVIFFVVVYALKKSFASKDDVTAQDKRLQTVEQTYVKNIDIKKINETVQRIEVEIEGLPDDVTELTKEVTKLQGETKQLHAILTRIEHPLQLIVQSKILGKE
ncbi:MULTISPECIES: DUF2730 family protein [unclassified Pseudoalteromonas]|uniref:DUF2730 family protein n=1 Tax=unclassified Pseudoalteromonas TaxID=194690 RepID=UPI002097D024|nr:MULTISPECIES: DUF2730 family protein [unclassified Pseudoalteromonas]MCO7251238.1 DUF2730 domain-containing protein [Pseudoalteromonas sp. Ps84H-4]